MIGIETSKDINKGDIVEATLPNSYSGRGTAERGSSHKYQIINKLAAGLFLAAEIDRRWTYQSTYRYGGYLSAGCAWKITHRALCYIHSSMITTVYDQRGYELSNSGDKADWKDTWNRTFTSAR